MNYSSHANLMTYTWPDRQHANTILMKFDMPALPSGAHVDAATCILLVQSDATADASYAMAAHKVVGKPTDVTRAAGYTADGQLPGRRPAAARYSIGPGRSVAGI